MDDFLFYPDIADLEDRRKTFLEKTAFLPFFCFIAAIAFFLIALFDPHQTKDRSDQHPSYKKGLAIYLLLDQSGSMKGIKWQTLQKASINFIKELPHDLIGAVAFARTADVVSPLTIDHRVLEARILGLKVVGDQLKDGTAIGYAIYKTTHLIHATKAFQGSHLIDKAQIIVLTDGLQDPSVLDKGNPLRTIALEDAALYAKKNGVQVFIINVEPRILEDQFAPNRHQMEKITELTGGNFIIAAHLDELPRILAQIPESERNQIQEDLIQKERISYFPYFLSIGLLFFFSFIALNNTIYRSAI